MMNTRRDARVMIFVSAVACGLALLPSGISLAAPVQRVTICHLPPGNPSNVQLITVGAPAVPAHVRQHGDAVCRSGAASCCADPRGEVCTNVQEDVNNCGGCNVVCAAGDVCTAGVCTCPIAGDTNCSGTCTDLANDPNNCGGCGNVCPAGTTCVSGACSSSTCAVVGQACSATTDCCAGTSCTNGVCVAGTIP